MSDLPDPAQEKRELQDEVERLKENNNVLAKIAHDLRGALQSIADGIGDQETAENALHRLTSRGIDGLDVDPEEVGIKGRIEELEAENECLREERNMLRLALAKAEQWVDEINPSARNQIPFRHLAATIKTNLDLLEEDQRHSALNETTTDP